MHVSILHWLGFEFVDIRCEADPDVHVEAQAEDVFAQCRGALARFGLGFEDNVRSRIWAVDRAAWTVASKTRFAVLSGASRGASSSYIAPERFLGRASIGLDLLAVRPRQGCAKVIKDFEPKRDAPPICYVTLGPLTVLSGMTVVLPTLEEQVATDILPRISGYLAEAGSDWQKVARVSCYLHRSQSPDEMRALFRRTAPAWPPQFEIVLVDGYSSDGKLVEIEVTAEREA
jgi:enamine deaminase RidA (YjgF/YER057c/UK114 family)